MYFLYLVHLFLFHYRDSKRIPPTTSQHTMAGFRQEDVELYYEMGEELGRYILLKILKKKQNKKTNVPTSRLITSV